MADLNRHSPSVGTPSSFLQRWVEVGILDRDQAYILEMEHEKTQKPFDKLCTEFGFMSPELFASLVAALTGVPTIDITESLLDPQTAIHLPKTFCVQNALIPLCVREGDVWVAFAEINALDVQDAVRRAFPGLHLRPFLAPRKAIEEAIDRYYAPEMRLETLIQNMGHEPAPWSRSVDPEGEEPVHPTIRFVHALILKAVKERASDIHLEPEKMFVRVRYRCDGLLRTICLFHKNYFAAVVVRLKIMSRINISETRRPQSGRMNLQLIGRNVDFRLSTHPTLHGENMVIRILDHTQHALTLEGLGYDSSLCTFLGKVLRQPEGLVVMTGPTGSGKTSSLYALLLSLSHENISVMTLEDPVEYQFPLIRQSEISETLSPAQGVRSILRQDPDVILIGEIRDSETAQMAMRAAMTGHLVLTTLHTPDALSAIDRLIELGIPRTLLAGYLNCVIAQRLIRLSCSVCRGIPLGASPCGACGGRGYQGRTAIAEIIPVDDPLRAMIHQNDSKNQMNAYLKTHPSFRSMREQGQALVRAERTTDTELMRVLGEAL